ncbi:hypothetical protein BJF83_20885 [Nocardiopsis sp. CNR-923]|uniref:hypothetical protein n=1 Tax=Nocardiopsis sp. CNR-923 TaxID=1904965 RepID=UPI000960C299|nr:hypothetical protein [Nocardiopsis sp. CNR-923]OLT26543.1 hypothetical protein BJF83_20885 [Nocardiopsis sp. CNR-923]
MTNWADHPGHGTDGLVHSQGKHGGVMAIGTVEYDSGQAQVRLHDRLGGGVVETLAELCGGGQETER